MSEPLPVEALLPSLAGPGSIKSCLRRVVEVAAGIRGVRQLLRRAAPRSEPHACDRILAALDVTLSAPGIADALPASGPVIVIANHPFGAVDALALLSLCQASRPDIQFLANAVLATIPELAPQLIPLEILGSAGPGKNLASLRHSLAHLKKGGMLGIFPAGAVSFFQWRVRRVEDPDWSRHAAALAHKSGAVVVPVRFAGRNRWWFQLLGMFHPLLRTALLLPAFLAARGKCVRCAAGPAIPPGILSGMGAAAATAFLRAAVAAIPLPPPTQ